MATSMESEQRVLDCAQNRDGLWHRKSVRTSASVERPSSSSGYIMADDDGKINHSGSTWQPNILPECSEITSRSIFL